MSKAIEEFGFRLSLGIQEVENYLTDAEIVGLERLAIEFRRRRNEGRKVERDEDSR